MTVGTAGFVPKSLLASMQPVRGFVDPFSGRLIRTFRTVSRSSSTPP